jgi:YVTN family beta-propeller protein
MTRDGQRVYVTNSRSNSISIVNTQSRKVERDIATGAGPNRIFLSPDEKTLLYSFQAGKGMGFADVATAKETARIALPVVLQIGRAGREGRSAISSRAVSTWRRRRCCG